MPISYDLAKTLEQAGWHQPDYKDGRGNGHWIQDGSKEGKAKVLSTVYAPSLSELIAECPKILQLSDKPRAAFCLLSVDSGWTAGYLGGSSEAMTWVLFKHGSIPEEAVARLWLTLKRGGEDA